MASLDTLTASDLRRFVALCDPLAGKVVGVLSPGDEHAKRHSAFPRAIEPMNDASAPFEARRIFDELAHGFATLSVDSDIDASRFALTHVKFKAGKGLVGEVGSRP